MATKKENIKVADFKSFEKYIPIEKTIDFNGVEIKVKQYLDIKDKQVIIEVVKSMAFDKNKVGVDKYNQVNKEVALVYSILKNYTNINLPTNDDYSVYNVAKGSGLYDAILGVIPKEEIEFIEFSISEFIEYKLLEMTNRSQLLEKLQEILYGIIDKLPKEIDMMKIAKQLEGIDDDKIKFFTDAFNINKKGVAKKE